MPQDSDLKAVPCHRVKHWDRTRCRPVEIDLIQEEPLSIRVDGNPYSIIMRTPGDEIAHAAGFCLSEGIIDDLNDYSSIAVCDAGDTNVVTVTLTASRRSIIPAALDRRSFISQTSCGICGREIVADLYREIKPVAPGLHLDADAVKKCIDTLTQHQSLREKTAAAHGAALFSKDFRLLSAAEDVGRHNALDKAIGKLFLENRLSTAAIGALSSRISYELVQKAARAGLPIVIAVSRPTELAVELASALNITLACLSRDDGLFVFTAEERIACQ